MAGSAPSWRTAGVSVPGVSHLRAGIPCQDAHRCEQLPGGVLVAVVADGAGSAARAEIGAACAVSAAVQATMQRVGDGLPENDDSWRGLLRSVFQEARAAVAAEASARGHPVGDLATTLLLAVATPDLLAAGQVGDGAIVARLAEQHFQTATRPPAQEFINETTLLTSAHLSGQVQFANLRGRLTGLALFSDGLQLLALQMPHATPHAPFFDPLLRFVEHTPDRATAEEQLRRFLQSPRLAERTDDDLTLVLAARTAG